MMFIRQMSFRRFLNLVSSDSMKCVYSLRRINMSVLFLPATTINNGGRSPAVKDDCCLPEPDVHFCSSHLRNYSGDMEFHLLNNKVVATDTTGGAVLYDPDKQAVRALPSHEWRKNNNVVSHAAGNNLYIVDRHANGSGTRSLEALVYTPSDLNLDGSWHWETLLPPPPHPGTTSIDSFAAVDAEGSKIWVSATGSDDDDDKGCSRCTHLYDAEKRAWSKEPADWVLPFYERGEYVPELNKLWFGISSREHGCLFCASDLSTASSKKNQPPAMHAVLEDTARASDGHDLIEARAIYLGYGKFCVARIFATPMRMCIEEEKEGEAFAVITGVEVTSSDGGVSMAERNSERYVLNHDDVYWVL